LSKLTLNIQNMQFEIFSFLDFAGKLDIKQTMSDMKVDKRERGSSKKKNTTIRVYNSYASLSQDRFIRNCVATHLFEHR
jgi:hypothetical protein